MESPGLDIRLFGSGSIRTVAPASELGLPRNARSVAAFLLLNRERAVERDEVAFALWPDCAEDEARANLRRALHLLQRALASVQSKSEWLIVGRRTLAWNRDAPYRLDVEEFERLCAFGHFAEAAPLYAGDLLATQEAEWLQPHRERLREMQFRALAALVSELQEQGEYAPAIAYAKQALRLDPWREDFVRALISLRAASGDRAGALGEYRSFAEQLRHEMGVEPMPETTALVAQTRVYRGEIPASRKPAPPAQSNLPPAVTAFVGRDHELVELEHLCAENRLVTLVGPGGVGKTRLAFALVQRIASRYRDGVRLIDMTPVRNESSFLQKVATALDIHAIESGDPYARIVAELEQRNLLVILDNCERAISLCATFAQRVLMECPSVTIVATSREPLGLLGEIVSDVHPLPVPDAVALMCRRVAAVFPRFALTPENEPVIMQICAKLDGIPLAIELAASHARALSPAQILQRLDDRFALLRSKTPTLVPHQQTLRGTIDWSYDLLPPNLARALRALAAFRGGFTLEGARAVCAVGDLDPLDVVEGLIDKSFVTTIARADEHRYTLLESIREYLLGKLRDAGEEQEIRMRHLVYFVSLAERLEPLLTTHDQMHAVATLADENDNLRAAFEWPARSREVTVLRLRLVAALRWYYWFRGFLAEGRTRSAEVLAHADGARDRTHARGLAMFGFFAFQQGDMQAAGAAFDEALAIYDAIGRDAQATLTEIHAGLVALFTGDRNSAEQHIQRASREAVGLQDEWLRAYTLGAAGLIAGLGDDRKGAIVALCEAARLLEMLGETFQRTFWLLNLAIQEYYLSSEAAAGRFVQCAHLGLEQRNERIIAGCFEGFGWCLQRAGDHESAARFLGAAQALRARTAQALLPQWHHAHEEANTAIVAALGEERAQASMVEGARWLRATSMEELCADARARLAQALRKISNRREYTYER